MLTAVVAAVFVLPPDAPFNTLPLTGLAPAKRVENLCLYSYRAGTRSADCQRFLDQGFGYLYSYVWMEAARNFETAARYDPDCALAWWGLSRALDKWGKPKATDALKRAREVLPRASHRERLLVTARLQEKGMIDGVGPDDRKKTAAKTLDELLVVHDDDQEAWFARAQVSDGPAAVPYYKALLRLNPLHPGANHELVHYYENAKRPALGWVYAEKYIESSPGLPHAFHMQAHLATRLGKWDKTSDRSARAVELERAYLKEMGVKPAEDHQYSHHLETLFLSLVHDGRYREARAVKAEAAAAGFKHWGPWFRLALAERDWASAERVVEHHRKSNKAEAAYHAALLAVRRGDAGRAGPELEALRAEAAKKKADRKLEYKLWEAQGLYLCRTGSADEGLKLLERAADKSKSDYGHHAWGNGASLMETWGLAALECGRLDAAEEAFLEALAHDAGSVRGAAGLQLICERQGRPEEARRYAALARKAWGRAEVRDFDALRDELSAPAPAAVVVEPLPMPQCVGG